MLVSHLVVGLIISLYFFPYVIRKPPSWIISTISTLSKFKTLLALLAALLYQKNTPKRPARIKTNKKGRAQQPTHQPLTAWSQGPKASIMGFLGAPF